MPAIPKSRSRSAAPSPRSPIRPSSTTCVSLGVDAVELMPVTAWIDERHLPPLGLTNGWGYNPVAFMALDPRLAPGGLAELAADASPHCATPASASSSTSSSTTPARATCTGRRCRCAASTATAYFRHAADGRAGQRHRHRQHARLRPPDARRLILDALRHFVGQAGVDGFRFDLAPILGRTASGFEPHAPLSSTRSPPIPLLADRVHDRRALGHRARRLPARQLPAVLARVERPLSRRRPPLLARRPAHARRARDRRRRLFRHLRPAGDAHVNFIAAHDGFTLADLVAYVRKHNEANGEGNRDGHARTSPGTTASRVRPTTPP